MTGAYYVYILTNRTRVLDTGMTNDLQRRVYEHKQKLIPGFTAKYKVDQLVWFEAFETADKAIAAEKLLKGWLRSKKIKLIQKSNPRWLDLSVDLFSTEFEARAKSIGGLASSGSREVLRCAQDDEHGLYDGSVLIVARKEEKS